MKTKVLLSIISIFISTALFSQNEIISKIDTTVLEESLSTDLDNLSLQKKPENQIELYKLPEFKGQFTDSMLQIIPKNLDTMKLSLSPPSQDGMPIVKPGGEFNMPIMVPDTTIDFKLKIQGYNKKDRILEK